jgi:tRNA-Thr(GGU) m(6)t(6)A37 methyltransferase TsaA
MNHLASVSFAEMASDASLVRQLQYECKAARAEVSKLHKRLNTLARHVERELEATRAAALSAGALAKPAPNYGLMPIGHIESCFVGRNGTPRQPGLTPAARARLQLRWGANPEHSIEGLEQFSHVWLLFLFDQNRGNGAVKSKVFPPRLDGAKTGVFACRSPHRPNPIGLSLVKLDRIEGDVLHLSGADLIDGTPVLDVKPYLPYADSPSSAEVVRAPEWVLTGGSPKLNVDVTANARANMSELCDKHSESLHGGAAEACHRALRFYRGEPKKLEATIMQVLQADPRSIYRKHKCAGQEYRVAVDGIEAVCHFDDVLMAVRVEAVCLQSAGCTAVEADQEID